MNIIVGNTKFEVNVASMTIIAREEETQKFKGAYRKHAKVGLKMRSED